MKLPMQMPMQSPKGYIKLPRIPSSKNIMWEMYKFLNDTKNNLNNLIKYR